MDEIFFEIFEALPRQGPGDEKSTRKAFKKLGELPDRPEILDVGCGTGVQTLALAKLTPGKITAFDNHVIRQRHQDKKDAQATLASLQQEIDMYRKYSKYGD